MRRSTAAWALAFVAAGAVVAGGWAPGASQWAAGPRIGLAATLLTLGSLLLAVPLVSWYLRRSARPGDYEGACPVGARCACGTFNLKPRPSCRACGEPTSFGA